MIKHAYLDLAALEESEFDDPFGISTGDAVLCGTSGGIMEDAVRTVYADLTGYDLGPFDFKGGLEGIKEANINLGGQMLKIAVVDGLKNARVLMEQIKQGNSNYHFIEVMCCPSGCIGGGGQPSGTTTETKVQRMAGLEPVDKNQTIYRAHNNPAVHTLYGKFLDNPLGPKSQQLLHTHYTPRGKK
jgi:NADH-quinone oxidoreductase subunit G/NADP-reducing hydrogenase subunit HndD